VCECRAAARDGVVVFFQTYADPRGDIGCARCLDDLRRRHRAPPRAPRHGRGHDWGGRLFLWCACGRVGGRGAPVCGSTTR